MDVLLKLGQVPFPSSVAVLILLFFGLLLSEWLLGNRRTRRAVTLLDVPVSTLRCYVINNPSSSGTDELAVLGQLVLAMDQCLLHPHLRLPSFKFAH